MTKPDFLPRRRVEELVSLYELEPEIVDFFVEGRSDRVLFEHILDEAGENVRVWEAGDIEIPAEMVANVGQSIGAKGRIVALAQELERLLSDGDDYSVLCVVDADFDHIIQPAGKESRFLARTDFSCLEAYYWEPKTVRKYLRLSLHGSVPLRPEEFMSQVENAVVEVFLLRLAVASQGLNFSWVDPASCCGDPRKGEGFDAVKYTEKVLNKNAAFEWRGTLEQRVADFRERARENVRDFIHGHDLCKLLSWLIKPYVRDRNITSEEVISRSLACCIDQVDIVQYPLFAKINELAGIGSSSTSGD